MRRRSYIAEALQLIRSYGLDRYREVAEFEVQLENGWPGEALAKASLPWLDEYVEREERCRNLLPKVPDEDELPDFDVEIGELVENPGVRVGLRFTDSPRHVMISGATGFGKTVMLRRIVNGMDAHARRTGQKLSIIILDMKGDFVDVPERLGRDRWDHYSVHDGFRLGLNCPANSMPPQLWINQLTKVVAARCGLILSASCLAAIFRFALETMNPSPARPVAWPSLPIMYDIARSVSLTSFASKPDYAKTLIQRLEEIVANSGALFDTLSGFDVIEHVLEPGRSAVIDMTAFDPRLANLVVDILISQLLYPRVFQRRTIDTTECVLVMDEADQFCSARESAVYPEGYAPSALWAKIGREFGLEEILALTFVGYASPYIRSNVCYHLSFNQQDPASITETARGLLLPPEGMRLLTSLQRGQCIYKDAQAPCSYGMLVNADYVAPARISRPSHFDQHPYVPGKDLKDIPELDAAVRRLRSKRARVTTQESSKAETSNGLSKPAFSLLVQATASTWYPLARLWEKTGDVPSFDVQKAVRKELQEAGFADFQDTRISSRNQGLILPTDMGHRVVGCEPPDFKGRGGLVHGHLCHWIAMLGKKRGHKTRFEWQVPATNHPVDVVWSIDGKPHAFEAVDTSYANITDHLRACLCTEQPVETVTIVACQKKQLKAIRKTVDAELLLAPWTARIHYMPAESLLKELF